MMVIQKKIHSLMYYLKSLKIFAYFNTLLEGLNLTSENKFVLMNILFLCKGEIIVYKHFFPL